MGTRGGRGGACRRSIPPTVPQGTRAGASWASWASWACWPGSVWVHPRSAGSAGYGRLGGFPLFKSTAPFLVILLAALAYAMIYAGVKNDTLLSVLKGSPTSGGGSPISLNPLDWAKAAVGTEAKHIGGSVSGGILKTIGGVIKEFGQVPIR